jgi:hypothetical protein
MANLNTLRGGIAHGSELAEDEEIHFAFERARLVSTTGVAADARHESATGVSRDRAQYRDVAVSASDERDQRDGPACRHILRCAPASVIGDCTFSSSVKV